MKHHHMVKSKKSTKSLHPTLEYPHQRRHQELQQQSLLQYQPQTFFLRQIKCQLLVYKIVVSALPPLNLNSIFSSYLLIVVFASKNVFVFGVYMYSQFILLFSSHLIYKIQLNPAILIPFVEFRPTCRRGCVRPVSALLVPLLCLSAPLVPYR